MEEDPVLSVKLREPVLLAIVDVVGGDSVWVEPTLFCIAACVFVIIRLDSSFGVMMVGVVLVGDIALVEVGALRKENVIMAASQGRSTMMQMVMLMFMRIVKGKIWVFLYALLLRDVMTMSRNVMVRVVSVAFYCDRVCSSVILSSGIKFFVGHVLLLGAHLVSLLK